MKFETAYCIDKEKEFTIDEISHIYKQDKVKFHYEYKGFLYCPECRRAKLRYNNAANPYFSAYPKVKHEENCSLSQETLTIQKSEKYVNNTANRKSIESQMDHLILLLSDQQEPAKISYSFPRNLSITQENSSPRKSSATQSEKLPRKRIDISWRPDDYDCYKLFYGTIRLTWEKYKNGYKILMKSVNDQKTFCGLTVSEKVYYHLQDECKTPSSFLCKIVFFALFSYNDKEIPITYLRYSDLLKIVKF